MYGQTSKQIGQKLSVSFRTVENIRARLLKKFHAKDAESIARQLFALDRPKSPKPKER
jgi:DNA-binding NarL/FixJ family response regulator